MAHVRRAGICLAALVALVALGVAEPAVASAQTLSITFSSGARGARTASLADGALVFGRASVPVVDGSASVPNVAFHGHVGIGFVF